jgi:hypothetical protein
MTRRRCSIGGLLLLAATALAAQDVSLEYRVKAAYLFNFTKFVEWPAGALGEDGPFTICIAERNPFGPALAMMLNGESTQGRRLTTRVVRTAADTCQVLFVPRDVEAGPMLRRLSGAPVLTVGEAPGFLQQGGAINFVVEGGKVRFEINQNAAQRGQLRVSSRLLRLSAGETGL